MLSSAVPQPAGFAFLGQRIYPDNNLVTVTGHRDWTSYEVTARVPGDANIVMFGIFLADRGRIELRDAELTRGT